MSGIAEADFWTNEAESNARDAEQLVAENERLRARIAELEGALVQIKETYGQVCDDFETCTHAACQSSYGAWETARQALEAETVQVARIEGELE